MNVMKYANYHLKDKNAADIKNIISILDFYRTFNSKFYKEIIFKLKEYEFYPVWNMPGHRGTHYFPTKEECAIWEDYLWQCSE